MIDVDGSVCGFIWMMSKTAGENGRDASMLFFFNGLGLGFKLGSSHIMPMITRATVDEDSMRKLYK